jgi:proteasome accessory factor C
MIPWMTAHTPSHVDEVCRRVGIGRRVLLAELDVLPFVGVPPYSPDTMISVDIDDDDMVSVFLAEPFDRPLRLTPTQALALVAAGTSIRAVPGADPGDALQRGLQKVATALGVDPDRVHVELGDVAQSTLDGLIGASRTHHSVEIGYFTYGRDSHSTRTVDPHRIYADQGAWYLLAWCHRSEDSRVFRIDRIDAFEVLEESFEPWTEESEIAIYHPAPDDPQVTLSLAPEAAWVVEQYPTEAVRTDGDHIVVTLRVSARPWLERLLVRLGDAATVIEADGDLAGAGADAADRVLGRYGAT